MKKGFTMIELLGVIVIITILLLIAIPIYNVIRGNINESVYESKIKEVLSKSESFAEEKNTYYFDIKTLIEEGILSADNELLEFIDPRDGRNMACDIITVKKEQNGFQADVRKSDVCYSKEELETIYGYVKLKIVDENENKIEPIDGWIKKPEVGIIYELQKENLQVKNVRWSGEEELNCTKENLGNCRKYKVNTSSIKNTTITIFLTLDQNGTEIETMSSIEINLDIQEPTVKSLNYNNDLFTESQRKVDFTLSDGSGSGIKAYAIVKEKTCLTKEFENNKKSAKDGVQTEYLNNGTYYICAEDKVGNKTKDEDLEKNKIIVKNIDTTSANLKWSILSSEKGENDWYKSLTLKGIVEEKESGILSVNYCITTNTTCTPNKETSLTNNEFKVELNSNSMNQKVCGETIDKVGNKSRIICSDTYKIDKEMPNIKSLTAENTWGEKNKITAVVEDKISKIIGYAFTKSSTPPTTYQKVNQLTNETFTFDATENQTFYFHVKDTAGNKSTKSITINKVDKTKPIIDFTTSISGNNITVDASKSNDQESGISKYCYKLDENAYICNTSPTYTFVGIKDGDHKVCAYVLDKANNKSEEICKTVKVDSWIEKTYKISGATSGYHGGSWRIWFAISAKNRTGFQMYYRNGIPQGLYLDCQVWLKDGANACRSSGNTYGKQNTEQMNLSSIEGFSGSINFSLSDSKLGSPWGARPCGSSETSSDSGWVSKTFYKPFFYHRYETNAHRYDSPSYKYQKVQIATSVDFQYRVVSEHCTCDDRNPDSDTSITCDLTVYLKVKFKNKKITLLDEANLKVYPDATGYLTEENVSQMIPTHMQVVIGSTWSGYEDNPNSGREFWYQENIKNYF